MSERFIKRVVLPGNNPYIAEHIYVGVTNDIRIGHDEAFTEQYGHEDEVWLHVRQFLMLLDWGIENRPALEKLAEEQPRLRLELPEGQPYKTVTLYGTDMITGKPIRETIRVPIDNTDATSQNQYSRLLTECPSDTEETPQ